MQEKTNDPYVPKGIGGNFGLGNWVWMQRQRKNGTKCARGGPLSKAEEDEVDSLHHALSL